MTGAELLEHIRSVVLRDTATPYLWSDAAIYFRLAQAEELHARKAYSIVDGTQTIDTVANVASYSLPTGTVFLLSVRESTQSRDMTNYTRRVLPTHLTTGTGMPTTYVLDEATNVIRFYPVPDGTYTIILRVARLPTTAIASYSSPEIPTQYHIDLASYVAWQCLSDNDVDGTGTKAADRHEKDWNKKVADAKREFYRLQLGNNASVVRSWTGKRNQ